MHLYINLIYPSLYLAVIPVVTLLGLEDSENSKTLSPPHGTQSSREERSVNENNMHNAGSKLSPNTIT